uniref:DUF4371 domain-containing protein n=1 Tax=Lactuca sativa TaxID=4236 RepID=A0A9R1VH70_LACSA|nr:hypothetical protein LSAT_V11C500267400 [Lactuca sativa]
MFVKNLMNQRQSITTFEKQTTLQEKEYRIRLNASIDCVRFLLRQGLTFRGHDETDGSDNKSNFLELLQWLDDRCDVVDRVVLKKRYRAGMFRCSYKCYYGRPWKRFFAILVDESHDVSCKEQLALVSRFVNKKGEVVEMFVGLRHVSGTSTLTIKETIYDMLSKWNLNNTSIRGNAMMVLLVLVFVAKNHTKVNDFFDAVSRLLNINGSSYKRRDNLRIKQENKVMEALLESGTGLNQEMDIKRPSDTQWGSHFSSLLNIKNIYSSICEVLEDLGKDNSDRDRKAEAICILSHKSFEYNITKKRPRYRKCHESTIQEIRDVGWEPLLGNVTLFCNKHDVRIVDMEDEYYDGFSRRRGSQVGNHRFNEANTKLLLCMACLCPRESFKAFDLDKLMEMATLYKEEFRTEYDLQVLEVEFKNYIKDVREGERFNQLKSIGEFAKKMVDGKKHIIYLKVYLLLKLALILPVATTSVERAFSVMKLVKTDVRNKMGDQFLSDSLVSYIEKNVLDSISNDTTVKLYQAIRPRRNDMEWLIFYNGMMMVTNLLKTFTSRI